MARPLVILLAVALPGALACGQHYWHEGRLLEESGGSAPGQVGAVGPAPGPAGAPVPHWTYNNNGLDWTGTCATGTKQSPIAITADNATDLPSSALAQLKLGTAKGLRIFNTGHALQVEWDALEGSNTTVPVIGNNWASIFDPAALSANSADVRQVPVKPLQIHWHSTCEHVVEGDMCPLELHIVTMVDNSTGVEVPERCKTDKCLAVFGVLTQFDKDLYAPGNRLYDTVTSNVPNEVGAKAATSLPNDSLDLDSLLPTDKRYVTYSGSLTTPPCSEDVQWHVFLQPLRELSAAQLDAFQSILASTMEPAEALCPAGEVLGDAAGNMSDIVQLECNVATGARTNNRAVQAINGRTLFAGDA